MHHELSDWLNRIGLLLGFISFWLVAPEFIGEARLQSWEKKVEDGILLLPNWFRTIVATTLLPGCFSLWPEHKVVCIIYLGTLITLYVYGDLFATQAVRKLANASVRQRALLLGAGLFTASFVMQLMATFEPH